MTKIWYLFFNVLVPVSICDGTEQIIHQGESSLVTKECRVEYRLLSSDRFSEMPYFSEDECHAAMNDARDRIGWVGGLQQNKMKNKIWGKRTRREFDCLDFLVGDGDASTIGRDQYTDQELKL